MTQCTHTCTRMHNTHPCTSHHKHNTDNTLAKVHTHRLHNTFITQGAHTTQCTCAALTTNAHVRGPHKHAKQAAHHSTHTCTQHSRGAHYATCLTYTHEPHTHNTPVPVTPLTQRMGKTHKHIIHTTHVHSHDTRTTKTAQAPHNNTHRHNAMCTTYKIRARVTQSRCIHTRTLTQQHTRTHDKTPHSSHPCTSHHSIHRHQAHGHH